MIGNWINFHDQWEWFDQECPRRPTRSYSRVSSQSTLPPLIFCNDWHVWCNAGRQICAFTEFCGAMDSLIDSQHVLRIMTPLTTTFSPPRKSVYVHRTLRSGTQSKNIRAQLKILYSPLRYLGGHSNVSLRLTHDCYTPSNARRFHLSREKLHWLVEGLADLSS